MIREMITEALNAQHTEKLGTRVKEAFGPHPRTGVIEKFIENAFHDNHYMIRWDDDGSTSRMPSKALNFA